MSVALRPYQERGVAAIRSAFGAGQRRVLFVLPTGGGNTTVFSHVTAATAARGKRVCILVHRQELVDQVSASLAGMGVAHGVIAGGAPTTPEPVQVASVASLVRRLDRVAPFDLIVPDEAHHAVAGSWGTINPVQGGNFMRRLRPMTQLPGLPAVLVAAHPVKNAAEDNLVPYGSGAILKSYAGVWVTGPKSSTSLQTAPPDRPRHPDSSIAPRLGWPTPFGGEQAVDHIADFGFGFALPVGPGAGLFDASHG